MFPFILCAHLCVGGEGGSVLVGGFTSECESVSLSHPWRLSQGPVSLAEGNELAGYLPSPFQAYHLLMLQDTCSHSLHPFPQPLVTLYRTFCHWGFFPHRGYLQIRSSREAHTESTLPFPTQASPRPRGLKFCEKQSASCPSIATALKQPASPSNP